METFSNLSKKVQVDKLNEFRFFLKVSFGFFQNPKIGPVKAVLVNSTTDQGGRRELCGLSDGMSRSLVVLLTTRFTCLYSYLHSFLPT